MTNSSTLTIRREAHALVSDVPHRVVVLEHGPADEVEPVERVDERLARARVALERAHVQLFTRYGEVERRAAGRGEREVDDGGEPGDLAAREAVRAGLGGEGLDGGRDRGVDRVGDVRVEEDVGRARVEDDAALALEE